MSDPAPEFPSWAPELANDTPRPVWEPPPIAERRQRVREGFDDAFIGRLAGRLGVDRRWIAERVGEARASVLALVDEVPTTGDPAPQVLVERSGPLVVVGGLDRLERPAPVPDGRPNPSGRAVEPVQLVDADSDEGQWLLEACRGEAEPSGTNRPIGSVTGVGADHLYELDLLTRRAEAVLGAPEVVPEWFQSTLGALGDTRPIDWVDTAAGRERLVEVLDAIAYGFPG